MIRRIVLTSAAAAALLAQPMEAEARARVLSKAEVRSAIAFFGACVVKREHDRARQAVIGGMDSSYVLANRKSLIQPECLRKSALAIVMSEDVLAGTFAEALIHADAIPAPAGGFAAVAPLVYIEPKPVVMVDAKGAKLPEARIREQQVAIGKRVSANNRMRLGECVARRDPAQVRSLLSTAIDTPEELAAIETLKPSIGECLPNPGQDYAFNRAGLRGAFAVGFYRLSQAAAVNGAAR